MTPLPYLLTLFIVLNIRFEIVPLAVHFAIMIATQKWSGVATISIVMCHRVALLHCVVNLHACMHGWMDGGPCFCEAVTIRTAD